MKKYKYVLFDWDGCLAKTLDIHLDSYKKTFAEYNIFPEDKTIAQEVFGDWNGPKKLGVNDIEIFTKKYLSRVNETYPTVSLYEGVAKTLDILKNRGKKMALITSSLRSTVQPALENNNLINMFDVFLAAEDVKNHKPDPEMINRALAQLTGNKEQAIIIGDSKSDLGSANNAAVDSLLYYPKHNEMFYNLDILKSYRPTFIVDKFKKILEIIS